MFGDIQKLFKSWGLYPVDELTDEYNPDVIDQGINRPCYNKFLNEADRLYHGEKHRAFFRNAINAQDDAYYVRVSNWAELEELYNKAMS